MLEPRWWIQEGDSALVIKTLDSASVDALVTDPPAGIGFMCKEWDGHKGGRGKWVAWLAGILSECRRIMKPGTYGWVWALPRTAHWTMTACEDAGFVIRDVLVHVFGTGFPKSRMLLKPASEHWILIKAPGDLKELRIEENRIGTSKNVPASLSKTSGTIYGGGEGIPKAEGGEEQGKRGHDPNIGRWPANFVLSHNDDCVLVGTKTITSGSVSPDVSSSPTAEVYAERERVGWQKHGDADGNEIVEAWECTEGCLVRMLDEQSGERPGAVSNGSKIQTGMQGTATFQIRQRVQKPGFADSGGASRFFYVAKSSTKERSAGLAKGVRNVHTTVKSTDLMRHLISLIAAPGSIILDPFAGSGSTGVAAVRHGYQFMGVEQSAEYAEIARLRIAHVAK